MPALLQVEKAPLESYADVGGLEQQIVEIKEAVELPLTHPELYEDIGIKPPKVLPLCWQGHKTCTCTIPYPVINQHALMVQCYHAETVSLSWQTHHAPAKPLQHD